MKRWVSTAIAIILTCAGLVLPARSAHAAVDVYTTPGYHDVNGRKWHTVCSPYSSTITRCRTEIWATRVTRVNGRYVPKTAWYFNNLTYVAAPRAAWAGNNLGRHAFWTEGGRRWKTECDSATTGYNACRSYIWSSHVVAKKTAKGWTYSTVNGWVINNMVRFTTDYYAKFSGTGNDVVALPKGLSEGLITYSHSGSSNFIVSTLSSENDLDEVTVDVTGTTKGTTFFGIPDSRGSASIEVQADGAWTLVVKPLTTAPKFSAAVSGSGRAVLWYTGRAATRTLTHSGSDNFIIDEATMTEYRDWKMLVNEIGQYSGRTAVLAGPAIMVLDADGPWSIS